MKTKKRYNRAWAILLAALLAVCPLQTSVIAAESANDLTAAEEQVAEDAAAEETVLEDAGQEDPVVHGDTAEEDSAEDKQANAAYLSYSDADTLYTVTMDANGGYFEDVWDDLLDKQVEKTEILQKRVPAGGVIDAVPVRIEEGEAWVFTGWSLDRDGSPVFVGQEPYMPMESGTVYAVWSKEDEEWTTVDIPGADRAEDLSGDPKDGAEELTRDPEDGAEDLTGDPEDAAEDLTGDPEDAAEDLTGDPEDAAEDDLESVNDFPAAEGPYGQAGDMQDTAEEGTTEGAASPEEADAGAENPQTTDLGEAPADQTSFDSNTGSEKTVAEEEGESDVQEAEEVREDPLFGNTQTKSPDEKAIRILAQPEDVIADYGTRIPLEIQAEGNGLHYQWYYRDSGASDWEPVQGRTESFYYIYLGKIWDGRSVMCRVGDAAGQYVDSQPAKVTVLPTISSLSAYPTLEIGEQYTLSISAQGKDLSYQWYYKMYGDTEWTLWEGKTHADEPIVMQEDYDGRYINCVVTAGNGNSVSAYDWAVKNFFWSGLPRISLKASLDPSVEEYSLYSISEGFQQYLELPENRPQSYSLKGHTYKILTGESVTIEDDIVRPAEEIWYYHQLPSGYWAGSTYPSGEEGEVTRKSYVYGDTVVRIDDARNITFHSVSYETEYAQQVADQYLAEHIVASMSEYEKAEQCCLFVAGYDYGTEYSGMTGMIVSGAGDCWASTYTLLYMLKKLGIASDSRYAGYDYGAGSGHYNVVAKLDGAYYILEAGYNEKAPRYYSLSSYGSPFSYSRITDKTIKITAYIDLDHEEEISVPSTIDGKTVVSIGSGGLSGISSVKKIILPDTIRSIDSKAFDSDYKLEEVNIPEGVEEIGASAFAYCRCLKTISIPSTVKSIGASCFFDCTGLTSIHVQKGNQFFEEKDGMLLRCGGAELVAFPPGRRGACTVPDGVKTLEKYSFAFSCPDSLLLPQSLRVIEPYAFYYVNMSFLSLPYGMTEVGERAFARSNINEIDLPETVVAIGEEAFFDGVNKIQLPEGLKTIGAGAFAGNIGLRRTIIPASVDSIGDYAFYLDYGWSSLGESQPSKSDNLVLFVSGGEPQFSGDKVFHDCVVGAAADSTVSTYAKNHELLYLETDVHNKIKLQDEWFENLEGNYYTYTGNAIKPSVMCKSGEGACPLVLRELTDFRVEYSSNTVTGKAMAVLKGIGAFNGILERPYTIEKGYQRDARAYLEKEEISVGEKTRIHLENAFGDVSYTVWREGIASVDHNGTVTGKTAGATTIYVTAAGGDNYNSITWRLPITVKPDNRSVSLDRSSADIATTGTMQLVATVTPVDAEDKTVTWSSSNPAVASVDQNGLVTAIKYGKAVITARTSSGKEAKCTIQTRFNDVNDPKRMFYEPVYWAVDRGITVCTVVFRPDDSVTRGEFVAFLWRVAGKPKSTARVNFKDVNTGTQFYDAIRWAVGRGIIKGYKDGNFKSKNPVTRGETATMLWRYAGRPAAKTKKSPFSDIKISTLDSCKAILWGSENGIIKGSKGKFLKDDGCTRGQVVTFLYRYKQKY